MYLYHVGDDLKYNMSYSLAYCKSGVGNTEFIYHFHSEVSFMYTYLCIRWHGTRSVYPSSELLS